MRAKEARLLRKQHVSEDPTRKQLVLSEEAEAVPAESEHSKAHIHVNERQGKTPTRPAHPVCR